MQDDSLVFMIPNIEQEQQPKAVQKPVDNLAVFQELNAIAEEIERCRGISY